MKKKCAVLGATGMVGRKFLEILSNHPWIEVVVVAASERSAGKTLKERLSSKDTLNIENNILKLV